MTHPVMLENAGGTSSALIVCEHASNHIPAEYDNLGLDEAAASSHVAWDPGALGVTRRLAANLNAVAVTGTTSRLVYDLNRPPDAHDAMTPKSELFDIPGNVELSDEARAARVANVYKPFRASLADQVKQTHHPVLVTVHSFTPVYYGRKRDVEIGILNDTDTRLADAMLKVAGNHTSMNVQRNAPYGPENGVTHTLREHAIPDGHLNVMLEIRNDLIAIDLQQNYIGDLIGAWVAEAFDLTGCAGEITCLV